MRRFYVGQTFPEEGTFLQLSPRETAHLHRVLRLGVGDHCEVFNGRGRAAEALIEAISETKGTRLRLGKIFPLKEKSLFLKVAQALPQKKKMDTLVEKAEELGVQELWILETERTIVKMPAEARERARKRWERIVIEAAKQSGSPVLTKIEGPIPFEKFTQEKLDRTDTAFLFHPDPAGLSFSEFIETLKESQPSDPSRALSLLFGPEGGFTEKERGWAESRGVRKVYLGDSILRLETAFLGVISAIRFLFP